MVGRSWSLSRNQQQLLVWGTATNFILILLLLLLHLLLHLSPLIFLLLFLLLRQQKTFLLQSPYSTKSQLLKSTACPPHLSPQFPHLFHCSAPACPLYNYERPAAAPSLLLPSPHSCSRPQAPLRPRCYSTPAAVAALLRHLHPASSCAIRCSTTCQKVQ